MTLLCPMCKKPVEFGAPNMPFCSERCKLLDLGEWASGKYVISTPIEPTAAPGADGEDDL